MNISLQNKTLLSILSSVKGVVPSRPTFPTQSMVLISPSDNGCFFFTQGPEAQIRCFAEELSIEKPEENLYLFQKYLKYLGTFQKIVLFLYFSAVILSQFPVIKESIN